MTCSWFMFDDFGFRLSWFYGLRVLTCVCWFAVSILFIWSGCFYALACCDISSGLTRCLFVMYVFVLCFIVFVWILVGFGWFAYYCFGFEFSVVVLLLGICDFLICWVLVFLCFTFCGFDWGLLFEVLVQSCFAWDLVNLLCFSSLCLLELCFCGLLRVGIIQIFCVFCWLMIEFCVLGWRTFIAFECLLFWILLLGLILGLLNFDFLDFDFGFDFILLVCFTVKICCVCVEFALALFVLLC